MGCVVLGWLWVGWSTLSPCDFLGRLMCSTTLVVPLALNATHHIIFIRLLSAILGTVLSSICTAHWRRSALTNRTPQAYPHLTSSALSTISTQYANIIAEHFVPSIPPIPILPPTK